MQNPSTDVLIQDIEIKQYDNAQQYKITGQTNAGRKSFKFYTTKKNGEETSAYGQFRSMGLRVGVVVNIAYEEEQKTHPTSGKLYADRRVIWFRESNTPAASLQGAASPTPAQPLSPLSEANRGQSGASGDAFGRRLGVQGHINALLSNPEYFPAASIEEIVSVALKVEDEAEKQLNAGPGYKAWKDVAAGKSVVDHERIAAMTNVIQPGELPTIQVDDVDDLAKDIPF